VSDTALLHCAFPSHALRGWVEAETL
jgi:hypothetical protein